MAEVRIDPVKVAQFFATVRHGGQLYAGFLPYTHHLKAVHDVLVRFAPYEEDDLLVAAWLHDVIEDTNTKKKDVVEMFGDDVADLVWAVTNEPGENRKIRHALTYPKIRANKKAVKLKLADRIANVEAGGGLVSMYQKEHEDFKRNLYTPGEYEDMWDWLDRLLA